MPERSPAGRAVAAAALAAQWRRLSVARPAAPELRTLGHRLGALAAAPAAPAGDRPLDLLAHPELVAALVTSGRPDAGAIAAGDAAAQQLVSADRPDLRLTAPPGVVRRSDWCVALAVVTAAELADRWPDTEVTELTDPALLRLAVRFLARAFAARAPGRSVELRIPPVAAVQCLAGPAHTRGTPPNVVEVAPLDWLRLGAGQLGWPEAVQAHRVRASGTRADLGRYLPLLRVPGDTLSPLPAHRNR